MKAIEMFTLKAPAKINWFLSVLGKRGDGYHDILSPMQCVTLYDSLTFEYSDEIEVITDAEIPPRGNLVYRAAALLKQRASAMRGARITLKKEIPMAAGLGGGSSDAACTLIGLNRLWKLGLDGKDIVSLGGMLGSDIPFFFNGPFALIEGRGERVTPLKINTSYVILLVKPPVSVSTAWAYANINSELTKGDNNIKLFCQAFDRRDFSSLAFMMKNDLEDPVLRRFPIIGELKDKLLKEGALISAMSGSGPTVFGIFETRQEAEDAANAMAPDWCRVVETITSVNSEK